MPKTFGILAMATVPELISEPAMDLFVSVCESEMPTIALAGPAWPFTVVQVMFGVENVQSPPSVNVDGAAPAPPPFMSRLAPKRALDAHEADVLK